MSHANDTATRPSLSFEFFPPKDDAGIDRLMSGTASVSYTHLTLPTILLV